MGRIVGIVTGGGLTGDIISVSGEGEEREGREGRGVRAATEEEEFSVTSGGEGEIFAIGL